MAGRAAGSSRAAVLFHWDVVAVLVAVVLELDVVELVVVALHWGG